MSRGARATIPNISHQRLQNKIEGSMCKASKGQVCIRHCAPAAPAFARPSLQSQFIPCSFTVPLDSAKIMCREWRGGCRQPSTTQHSVVSTVPMCSDTPSTAQTATEELRFAMTVR